MLSSKSAIAAGIERKGKTEKFLKIRFILASFLKVTHKHISSFPAKSAIGKLGNFIFFTNSVIYPH